MGSTIKNERSYVALQAWMVNDLGLKGNDLIVYAIIFGFSMDGNNCYQGSLQYLADWTSSTKQGVQKNLKNLIDRGLIEKEENYVNGVKFCKYRSCIVYNSVAQGMQHSCMGGMQLSCTNNIDKENIEDNIDSYIYNIDLIISYLNQRNGSRYKASTSKTQSLIKARLKEGYTVNDFYTVIDNKCTDWKGTEYEKFLRPETLFGNKFEGYLNQKIRNNKQDVFGQVLEGSVTIHDTTGNGNDPEDAEGLLSLPF